MKLKLERIYRGPTYTIGNLYLNFEDGLGFTWFSNTLEDKCRIVNNDCKLKVFGQTAIPEGTYDVEMLWWTKHKNWYPHIKDVKCFEGILIHAGRKFANEEDTEGCILVGYNKIKGKLIDGMQTMEKLRVIIKDALNERKEVVTIMIY